MKNITSAAKHPAATTAQQYREQQILHRVNLYLDKSLPQEEQSQFLEEVRHNSVYRQTLQQEQHFRELIRNGVARQKASPALIQAIKEKIKVSPDQV